MDRFVFQKDNAKALGRREIRKMKTVTKILQ